MHLNETDEVCRCCKGQRIIEGPAVVGRICPQCSGKGYTDWVSHAMDRRLREPPDHKLLYNITMKNIEILKREMMDQARQIGLILDVRLEMQDERQFEQEYLLKPIPPMFIKGGL